MKRISFLVVLLCTIFAMAAPALAAFEAKESKENSVTYEAKETPIAFLIEEKKEVKAEVACETSKGEGVVDEKAGFNGATKYDAPASAPEVESEQIGLKVKMEKCSGMIAGIKGTDIVNTEKCQFEIYNEQETKGEAEASLSMRGNEKEKPCTMTIESSGKCKMEIKSAGELENEELQALKLTDVKEFEMKIEPSEIKKIKTETSGCELPEKTEGILKFKKAIFLKGVNLMPPVLTKEVEKVQQQSRIIQLRPTAAGNMSSVSVGYLSHFSNTDFGMITVLNTAGTAISKGGDTCSGNSFPDNTGCGVFFNFSPPVAGAYEGTVTVPYTFNGRRGSGGQLTERIVGTGT